MFAGTEYEHRHWNASQPTWHTSRDLQLWSGCSVPLYAMVRSHHIVVCLLILVSYGGRQVMCILLHMLAVTSQFLKLIT